MKRVAGHHSKVLGQGRGQASSHVDVSLAKELGWGAHTLSVGSVSFTNPAEHVVNQIAAVYVSESALLVVLVSDKNDPLKNLLRAYKEEKKYIIRFSRITDLRIIRKDELMEEDSNPKNAAVFKSEEEELRRTRVIVYLGEQGGGGECHIDTHDTPLFARHVSAAWASWKVLSDSRINKGKLLGNASVKLAMEYLGDVSNDIRELMMTEEPLSSWQRNKFSSLEKICLEFAGEVSADLALKECAFKSREVIVQLLVLLKTLLDAPSGCEKELEVKRVYGAAGQAGGAGSQPPSPQKSFSFTFPAAATAPAAGATAVATTPTLVPSTTSLRNRLADIILQRVKLIRQILNALCSLFLCSESVSCRSTVLLGPPPLEYDAWFQLLCKDVFEHFCAKFRVEESLGGGVLEKNEELEFCCTSVRTLQCILLSDLSGVGSTYYLPPQWTGASRHDHHFDLAPVVVGDVFVRQPGWEGLVEFMVMRIGSLLDEMINADRAEKKARLFGKGNDGGGGRGKGAGRLALGGGGDPSTSSPQSKVHSAADKISTSMEHLKAVFGKVSLTLPPSPKASRKGMRTDSGGAAASATHNHSHFPLETQEILVFKLGHFLRTIAWDSAKIRELLQTDLLQLFVPIFSLFDIVCPRVAATVNAAAAASSSSSNFPKAASEVADKTSAAGKFLGCFGGSTSGRGAGGGGSSQMTKRERNGPSIFSPIMPSTSLFPWLPLTKYGPSLLDLGERSMALVSLARRNIEDCLNVLSLEHDAYFRYTTRPLNAPPELELSPRSPEVTTPRKPPKPSAATAQQQQQQTAQLLTIATSEDELEALPLVDEDMPLLGSATRRGPRSSSKLNDSPRSDEERDRAPLLKRGFSPIRRER